MTDFDPESAFIGAVLHMSAPDALIALDLVRDEDFAEPRLQLVAGLVRQVAEDGVTPDPVTVLAYARANGTVAKPEAIRGLTRLLADVYGGCPTPASGRWYAVGTLDEALRRRCTEMSTRIGQAAKAESLDSLMHLVDTELHAVREVRDRRAAAAGATAPARLTAVTA